MQRTDLTDSVIESLAERVRPYLTELRYGHTRAVEREAAALGGIYCPEKIPSLRVSALLHDITKRLPMPEQIRLCGEFGIPVTDEDRRSPSVFHAMTGAAVAARDFSDIVDDEILSGIRWHTTGRAGMTLFESLIYLADYIEETRTFDDCVRLRRLFWDGIGAGAKPKKVLTDVMIESFDATIRGLLKDGAPIAADTVAARNDYILRKNAAAETQFVR